MSREDVTIMAHRRADWGSVTKVSPGVWRIRYWADGPDGYRRRSKTVRGSRKDAGDALAALRLDHSADAPCPTVGQCWDRWYAPDRERDVGCGDLAESSWAAYRSAWNSKVAPRWADVPVDAVRPLDVQQWLSGFGPSQARIALIVLRGVLAYAVRYELVDTNVAEVSYVMPSASTRAARDTEPWDVDGLLDVCRAVRGKWYEGAVLLSAFGSCRVGESLGVMADEVRLREVDVDGTPVPVATVGISRQVLQCRRCSERLKTPQSRRTVVIVGEPALRLASIAASRPGDWLSGDGDGRPPSRDAYADRFPADIAAAGCTVHPIKNLRNTWETVARWVLGMPPWISEPMMGHAGKDVTSRHYDKPREDEFVDAMARAYARNPYADAGIWDGWD